VVADVAEWGLLQVVADPAKLLRRLHAIGAAAPSTSLFELLVDELRK
jgi:hypothetical protein